MVWIQRAILILGVFAALGVTFLWPPKILQGMNGVRIPVVSECGRGPKSTGNFGMTITPEAQASYDHCVGQASVNTPLLLSYLAVILGSTLALASASRPPLASQTPQKT